MIISKVKIGFLLAALAGTAAMSAPQTAPQAKTCLFYEHFNYGGEHFGLFAGDMLTTNASVNPKGVYAAGATGRKFVDAKWTGRVSSLKVPKNCSAIVYNGKDSAAVWERDLNQFTPQYNDKSVGFGCTCK